MTRHKILLVLKGLIEGDKSGAIKDVLWVDGETMWEFLLNELGALEETDGLCGDALSDWVSNELKKYEEAK